MDDGPYTSGDVGHAVTVVGYEHDTGVLRDKDHNYKVHTGYSDPPNDNADAEWYTYYPPEHINHGNWEYATIIQIWTE